LWYSLLGCRRKATDQVGYILMKFSKGYHLLCFLPFESLMDFIGAKEKMITLREVPAIRFPINLTFALRKLELASKVKLSFVEIFVEDLLVFPNQ
jgi:hypothetical protein